MSTRGTKSKQADTRTPLKTEYFRIPARKAELSVDRCNGNGLKGRRHRGSSNAEESEWNAANEFSHGSIFDFSARRSFYGLSHCPLEN